MNSESGISMITNSEILLLFGIVILGFFLYISKIKKANETEKMLDAETGMGNLQYFKYHFKYSLSDDFRYFYHVAYIILDTRYLRTYYDDSSFEEVLKYAASVLSEHTEDGDIPARISENGFAFAFKSIDEEDAKNRFSGIMEKLNSFEGKRVKDNRLVFHSAIYHLGNSDKNCELLLFNLRKNCIRLVDTETQMVFCDVHAMNSIQEENKLTEAILKGLEKNEFKMYLQFIVDNKTKNIVSAEALSRWDRPQKGLVGPGEYIENMENTGIIGKHDLYMFECALRQLEKWKDTELEDLSISCNFTRITLSEEGFIDKLKRISDKYDFDKSKLSIEITEDAIEKDIDVAMENVKRCKELGFRIYLDDLGSGYTSLTNLCDYPIDVVKIDRSILLKTDTDKGKDLFKGIVALAHSLGIKATCEGVETEEQNLFVSGTDCDFIQGWYYSKPLPEEKWEGFLKEYKA
ncbi:MAG: EAL domain-containing protein [Clostridia bacterium]|nr:EAL domain-containing protein [Clostridia bacterium]